MKKVFSNITVLFLFTIILFTACKKERDVILPAPSPVQQDSIAFEIKTLPEPITSGLGDLQAIVSISDANNTEVVTNKRLLLQFNGKYVTEKIKLAPGNYKLTRFLLVDGGTNARFATPQAGSPKAPSVTKPLQFAFTKTTSSAQAIIAEVIRVAATDKPQDFGYPNGVFNGKFPESPDPFMLIKVKAVFQIGSITYDQVPASLALTTYDQSGQMTTTYQALQPGSNEVRLNRSAASFKLHVSRWGITDEMTLTKAQVDEETEYILGGSKAAKKLKQEVTYKLVNGSYIPESLNKYVYNTNGNLKQIEYYEKRANGTSFLSMKDIFDYNATGKVEKINRFNESNAIIETTSFVYDQQGKIISMVEKSGDTEINAAVSYFSFDQSQNINIRYQYNSGLVMNQNMSILRGNIISSNTNTTNMTGETGDYEFDTNINPFAHMNWPDFLFSNYSRNNVTIMRKQYTGNFPVADPTSFQYTYDADGYPKEVIKAFRNPRTNLHVFTLKTVYTY